MSPEEYHEFWSSVGFWVLVAGLIGDVIVLFVPSRKRLLEKSLSVVFTALVIMGVWIEHHHDSFIKTLAMADKAKFEARLIPRHLNREARARLVAKLEPFAGQGIAIFSNPEGVDVRDITAEIVDILRSAHWELRDEPVREKFLCGAGMLVWAYHDAAPKTLAAAEALASGLTEEGLGAVLTHAEWMCTFDPPALPDTWGFVSGRIVLDIGPK